jgi:glycosyltransferase involved in cell wall biosynthesis
MSTYIGILTSAHSVLDGRIFHKQAISLSLAGYEVTLIGPLVINASELMSEVGIKYLPILPLGNRAQRIRQWLYMIRILQRSDYHIWHFHDPELLPIVIICKWFLRKKVQLIYDVHEDVPKDILDKGWILSWLRKPISIMADRVEGWGIKRCDLTVAATDSIASRVSRFTSRFVTIHNYPKDIHIGKALNNRTSSALQIIYAGNMTPIRGLREVVQAMRLVQDCQVTLHLVGLLYPQEFENEIRALAGSNVKIYGKVSFEETQRIMANCEIGIVTFHPLPNHIEAMPNKLFEYMQKGLPVIASNFPLWETIIREADCGITVDPLNPEEIAQAIRTLVCNPKMRLKMGCSGMRAVNKKYSWLHEENKLIEAYRGLLNE